MMKDFDFIESDGLSEIDELLEMMESDNESDESYDDIDMADESEFDVDDVSSDKSESAVSVFIDSAVDYTKELYAKISDKTYQTYTDPNPETLVDNKNSLVTIIIASSAAVFVALAFALYFFLTSFNYYTTGVTVDEFIDGFNNVVITSDSDIYELMPSFTDVIIPEDAKLSGNNTIELMDGHIVIDATTRFGKIVDLKVSAVDYPGYNYETYAFDEFGGDYFYYFYVCMGKAIAAFGEEGITIDEAFYCAFQMNQYAYIYMFNNQTDCSITLGDNTVAYNLKEVCLTVEPTVRTLTTANLPEWLKIEKNDEVDADYADAGSAENETDSSTEPSNSDAA